MEEFIKVSLVRMEIGLDV